MFTFSFFQIIFNIMFFIIISMFVIAVVGGIKQWNKNNNQPVLYVNAKLISKRTNISRNNNNHSRSTSYYCTFEVESGDRIEFRLSGNEYGLLAENDAGKLKFQGTRYLGFQRNLEE
ncbi:DUF2500 domain-containing protein [Tepidibacter hydrothermalis]|uniref:DUF2500 domain-containing protein n=1 Tax=Tepidibacter hydrothermalis TaxID=3036126 RepID=A0ABY8EEN6_9FIRM|nr:DUF2500 domain-containing protein [Tepidibacter hydrothermalis]WFD09178.1 DUF2500 domain-containing protein [Tepidibacter hydrothermalis]